MGRNALIKRLRKLVRAADDGDPVAYEELIDRLSKFSLRQQAKILSAANKRRKR